MEESCREESLLGPRRRRDTHHTVLGTMVAIPLLGIQASTPSRVHRQPQGEPSQGTRQHDGDRLTALAQGVTEQSISVKGIYRLPRVTVTRFTVGRCCEHAAQTASLPPNVGERDQCCAEWSPLPPPVSLLGNTSRFRLPVSSALFDRGLPWG